MEVSTKLHLLLRAVLGGSGTGKTTGRDSL